VWSWALKADWKRRAAPWLPRGEAPPGLGEVDRRFRLAEAAFLAVIRGFPKSRLVGSYAQLALALCRPSGQASRHLSDLRRVISGYPEFPERGMRAQLHIAEALWSAGRRREATAECEELVARYSRFRNWRVYEDAQRMIAAPPH